MNKIQKIFCASAILVALWGTGISYELCEQTCHERLVYKISYFKVHTKYQDSFISKWMSDEFGITNRGEYTFASFRGVLYINSVVIGAPQGLWLFLRKIKASYEKGDEITRNQIKDFMTRAYLKHEFTLDKLTFKKFVNENMVQGK